jgi:hypothetical protein
MADQIKYREGYKYILAESYTIQFDQEFPVDIITKYVELTGKGLLTIKEGFAWDGVSGPAIDTPSNMRGGCVHDALYYLMREGLLNQSYRHFADHVLQEICKKDGMGWFRCWYYFEGVDHFAKYAAAYGSDPYPILTAP